MISIGIAQTPNTADVEKNFNSIMELLSRFKNANVDLVLFPECSLSGFTAKMRDCSRSVLRPYLDAIQNWTNQTNIEVILPTAFHEDNKVYNSGFWFKVGGVSTFYKIGLTESEKKFFSVPTNDNKKVFEIKDFKFVILVCFEAQHEPWLYFKNGDADAILWPGYWGWTFEDKWEENISSDKPNLIYQNMTNWKIPLLQSNFAFNDIDGHIGAGPEGLSLIVSHDNKPYYRGPHLKSDGFIVNLSKISGKAIVTNCIELK